MCISMINKKRLWYGTGIVAFATLILILVPGRDTLWVKIPRTLLGSVYLLFLPGYWLTLSFFKHEEIDWLERFALSFALSISVVPLLTFYTNLLGLKITSLSVRSLALLIIIGNILWLQRAFIFKKHR